METHVQSASHLGDLDAVDAADGGAYAVQRVVQTMRHHHVLDQAECTIAVAITVALRSSWCEESLWHKRR